MWILYRAHEAAPGWFRRLLWKSTYEVVAHYRPRDFAFMNLGYMSPEPKSVGAFGRGDEWLQEEMYRLIAGPVPLENLRVLEVGCGRGGGAALLCRERRPSSYVGVDRSETAVEVCRALHASVPNLRFVAGDAETLSFQDGSFDAVLNVESSHCYGDLSAFARQVHRVLSAEGRFAWADIHSREKKSEVLGTFSQNGFAIDEVHDMTAGVIEALRVDRKRLAKMLGRRLWNETGRVWRRLERGEMAFTRCAMHKIVKAADAGAR